MCRYNLTVWRKEKLNDQFLSEKNRCVIISGSPRFWVGEIKNTDYIIACDSGYRHAQKANIVPDLVVGDFDSYYGQIPKGIEVYAAPREKDDTDTMLAVKLAFKKGMTDILLLGATGGRIDHQLANVATAAYIAEHGGRCLIADYHNEIYALKNSKVTIEKRTSWAASVLSFSDECKGVSYSGLKYNLTDATLCNTFPLGVSNEIIADEATVEVREGILLVILSSLNAD